MPSALPPLDGWNNFYVIIGSSAAGLIARYPALALYMIGAAALALLFIGIHNTWDLAVWITTERPGVRSQPDAERTAKSGARPEGGAAGAAALPDARG
ncbi:MAG: hypothetical protein WA446_16880 [Steroidobacteraceae bacterium]